MLVYLYFIREVQEVYQLISILNEFEILIVCLIGLVSFY